MTESLKKRFFNFFEPKNKDKKPTIEVKTIEVEKSKENFNFESSLATESAPNKDEDRAFIKNTSEFSFFGVLDGLGGQEGGGGNIAAEIISESFQETFIEKIKKLEEKNPKEIENALREAVFSAQEYLKNSKEAEKFNKMGTTLSSAFFYENKVSIVSVGDSRIYRLRDGNVELLSKEDSLIQMLRDNGVSNLDTSKLSKINSEGKREDITLEEALIEVNFDISDVKEEKKQKTVNFIISKFKDATLKQLRNINTQALGLTQNTEYLNPNISTLEVLAGDEFFITSDGLTDNATDKQIEEVLNNPKNSSVENKAQALKDLAKQMQNKENNPDANKPDDITILCIKTEKDQLKDKKILESLMEIEKSIKAA